MKIDRRVNVVLGCGWDGKACLLEVERATTWHLSAGPWDLRLCGLRRGYRVICGQTPLRLEDFPEAARLAAP